MGPDAADAIATRLGDPRDRDAAARAFAWLYDERAREPLTLMINSDDLIAYLILGGGPLTAMARLGGPDAVAVLSGAADRVIAAADAGELEWRARQAASDVGQALLEMRDPATDVAYDRLVSRFGRLYVVPLDPLEPYRAPSRRIRAARSPAGRSSSKPPTSRSTSRYRSSVVNRCGSASRPGRRRPTADRQRSWPSSRSRARTEWPTCFSTTRPWSQMATGAS